MYKWILLALFVILASSGCATAPKGVDVAKKTNTTVHQKVDGGIELPPLDSKDKLVSFDLKSTAQYDVQAQQLSQKIRTALEARGWKVVEPSQSKLAIVITVEGLEQSVYNQRPSSGSTGGVVGGVLGGIASGNVNGALLGAIAGAIAEKSFSNDAQDIYWQMNTRVAFRTKGMDLTKVRSIAVNTPSEFGDQRDTRRISRMSRNEEERLEILQRAEERAQRRAKLNGQEYKAQEVKAEQNVNEWSKPTTLAFSHSANKADLQLDEALNALHQAFVNSLSGVM